jgi:hypothetical protein
LVGLKLDAAVSIVSTTGCSGPATRMEEEFLDPSPDSTFSILEISLDDVLLDMFALEVILPQFFMGVLEVKGFDIENASITPLRKTTMKEAVCLCCYQLTAKRKRKIQNKNGTTRDVKRRKMSCIPISNVCTQQL